MGNLTISVTNGYMSCLSHVNLFFPLGCGYRGGAQDLVLFLVQETGDSVRHEGDILPYLKSGCFDCYAIVCWCLRSSTLMSSDTHSEPKLAATFALDDVTLADEDEMQLRRLGHKQQLHRSWHLIENFAAGFSSVNSIGFVRSTLFLGLLSGGPAAVWSSYVVTLIFMIMTAMVLAEICSALPLSGSIYIWAAGSAGPKYARFFGFLVAWWSCTSWIIGTATCCQIAATYIVSIPDVWESHFPGGIDNSNIKWRATVWAVSEALLLVSVAINHLPPKLYSFIFKLSVVLLLVDFLLCLIWLPIGASRTYGLRSAKEVFTQTYNGTGASAGWNWVLSFLFTFDAMIGFDASGHIAEETKNARIVAGKGLLSSAVVTGFLGFATTILYLFCIPDLDTLFKLNAPQPFVVVYDMALGRAGCIFMTIIAVLGMLLTVCTVLVASSRLIFAIARDGVLPLSNWLSQVDASRQPRNAVNFASILAALVLCVILPSQAAFSSLVSASAVPLIAGYGLIALLRLTMTPNGFKKSYFYLGRHRRLFYIAAVLFNAIGIAATISPFTFPVTASTLNFACVIFGSVTIFGILSWYFTPEERWLPRDKLAQALESCNDIGVDD
ncbi:hypothetical protein APHAL10511_005277 [Amanita phalloides]|nr:hypothetical protein APHAL10511_005277 [Amanita phalloides]